MKKFFKFFAAAAIVATAAGCAPENPQEGPQGNDPKEDVLSAPELTATASEGSIAFTWTSGTIEGSELDVNYTLYVGKAGSDLFEDGVIFEEAGLSYTINGEEYIALLNDMGCQSGGTVDMIAVVAATSGKDTKTSSQAAFTAGLPEAEVVLPETLNMKGGACPGGWETATVLTKTAEGIYEAAEVTLLFGKPEDGKGFKFFVSEEAYPFYGQDNAEGAAFGDIKVFASENDGDSQFYPLQNGYVSGIYTINVNLNTLKLTLTKTADVFEPSKPFYVFGEGLDGKAWEFVEELKLSEIEKNIFEGHNIHIYKNSSFKFDNEDWTEYQRDDAAGEYWTVKAKVEGEDIRFVPSEADPNFADGKYTVRLDLNTMKVTLTLTEADPEVTYAYLYGAAFADYTDWVDWIPVPSVAENVYEATINLNVGDASYARGFKIYKGIEDWGSEHCMYSDSTKDNIKIGLKDATGDNQVTPFNLGYTESGNYVVRIDFNTMTVTLTKAN